MKTALVIGASGLVGGELVKLLSASPEYGRIILLSRRPLNIHYPKTEVRVIDFDSPIDSHFVSFLESKLEKTSLKRVDSDVIDQLIKKEEEQKLSLSEEESTSVKSIFEKTIAKETYSVEIAALQEDAMPVTVTMDEFMRRMKEMAQNGGGGMGFYGSLPDNYKVTVNGNHPLIKRILSESDEANKEKLAKQAFDLALLSRGLLTGPELTEFVNRSVSLI